MRCNLLLIVMSMTLAGVALAGCQRPATESEINRGCNEVARMEAGTRGPVVAGEGEEALTPHQACVKEMSGASASELAAFLHERTCRPVCERMTGVFVEDLRGRAPDKVAIEASEERAQALSAAIDACVEQCHASSWRWVAQCLREGQGVKRVDEVHRCFTREPGPSGS